MQYFPLVFLISWLTICVYAKLLGGQPERTGAAIMFFGALVSYPAAMEFGAHWSSPEYLLFVVDLFVLAALLVLVIRYDKAWPIWASASQLVGVTTHVVVMVDHRVMPDAYAIAQPFWAYPALIALAAGTWKTAQCQKRKLPLGCSSG